MSFEISIKCKYCSALLARKSERRFIRESFNIDHNKHLQDGESVRSLGLGLGMSNLGLGHCFDSPSYCIQSFLSYIDSFLYCNDSFFILYF